GGTVVVCCFRVISCRRSRRCAIALSWSRKEKWWPTERPTSFGALRAVTTSKTPLLLSPGWRQKKFREYLAAAVDSIDEGIARRNARPALDSFRAVWRRDYPGPVWWHVYGDGG